MRESNRNLDIPPPPAGIPGEFACLVFEEGGNLTFFCQKCLPTINQDAIYNPSQSWRNLAHPDHVSCASVIALFCAYTPRVRIAKKSVTLSLLINQRSTK